jgi:hypothetical protein
VTFEGHLEVQKELSHCGRERKLGKFEANIEKRERAGDCCQDQVEI